MKNHDKIVLKSMLFLISNFKRFFFGFLRFWLHFGRPRGLQKSIKIDKNRVRGAYGARLGFWIVFGMVLAAFWEGFGKIFGRRFGEIRHNFGKGVG